MAESVAEAHYHGTISVMALARSRLTAQGQISVPAEIRRKLGVGPGSVLEWHEEGEIDALEMLLNHVRLTVQDSDAAAAALVEFRKYPAVGFADCLILEATRKAGHLPLGTFDRPLARLQGVHEL